MPDCHQLSADRACPAREAGRRRGRRARRSGHGRRDSSRTGEWSPGWAIPRLPSRTGLGADARAAGALRAAGAQAHRRAAAGGGAVPAICQNSRTGLHSRPRLAQTGTGAAVLGSHGRLNMSYIFAVDTLQEIVKRRAGLPHEQMSALIIDDLVKAYPGHIEPRQNWFFSLAAGAVGIMHILHGSLTEHLLFF